MKLTRSLISVATLLGAISGAFAQNFGQLDTFSLDPSRNAYTNDTYAYPFFSVAGPIGQDEIAKGYQWGLEVMNFRAAWLKSEGHAYIGVFDPGYPGKIISYQTSTGIKFKVDVLEDLKKNFRSQFSPGGPYSQIDNKTQNLNLHTSHVMGIIAAETNNGKGIAGACKSCSVSLFTPSNNTVLNQNASFDMDQQFTVLEKAVYSGVSIINWSGGFSVLGQNNPIFHTKCEDIVNLPSYAISFEMQFLQKYCFLLRSAKDKNVLVVQSAGNYQFQPPEFPSNSSDDFSVLPVGGIEVKPDGALGTWFSTQTELQAQNRQFGSSYTGLGGVMAPAKDIVSTVPQGEDHMAHWNYPKCGDTPATDQSAIRFGSYESPYNLGYNDGYGSCTGTSMAAPHVTALAGLVWSVNPLLSASEVRNIIRQSGSTAHQPTPATGYGVPDALKAVNAAIATNPSRLTPLFSLFSAGRSDSFYTTVPQMANAAIAGTLLPKKENDTTPYLSTYGRKVAEYSDFPGVVTEAVVGPSPQSNQPQAEVYIFTTHENPKNPAVPLVPLYRMSWVCGDSTPTPSACFRFPAHRDTTYTTTDPVNGVKFFEQLGYKLDGIEGYIYPKTMPQPTGTVRLMRKYNPVRDDHAIFPESQLTAMYYLGYTQNTGSDWMGYVYPNHGYKPTVQ